MKLRYRHKLWKLRCGCDPMDFIEYITLTAELSSVCLKYLKSLYVCLSDVCVLSHSFHHL